MSFRGGCAGLAPGGHAARLDVFYGSFFSPSKTRILIHVLSCFSKYSKLGLSENVGYIPNEIAIFHRDNDHENHWVQWGTNHFQTHPIRPFWAPQFEVYASNLHLSALHA